MKKTSFILLCALFFFFNHLFSEENNPINILDQLSHSVELTDGLPNNIINNTVSVISGEYIDSCVDVILPGPRPLVYARTYSSFIVDGTFFRSWNDNQRSIIHAYDTEHEKKKIQALTLKLPQGSNYTYKVSQTPRGVNYELIVPKGFTNDSTAISARANIKNTKIHYDPNKKTVTTFGGDGHKKIYRQLNRNSAEILTFSLLSDCNSRNQIISFDMSAKKRNVKGNVTGKISASGELSGLIYSSLTFERHSDFKNHHIFYMNTSDGRRIEYTFKKHEHTVRSQDVMMTPNGSQLVQEKQKIIGYYLKKVDKPHAPLERYEYIKRDSDDLLQITSKKLPNHRYLKTEYYQRNRNSLDGHLGIIELDKHDFRIDRVKRQSAPVGEDDKPVTICRFDYHADIKKHKREKEEVIEGETDVYDAYWHKMTYDYDKNHRLKKILKYTGDSKNSYSPYSFERFFWGKKKTSNADNLMTKYLADWKTFQIHHGYHFSYDDRGNTLVKSLFGKLTGNPSPDITLNEHNLPKENGYEREDITYTYSNDGFNLVLSEKNCDGKLISYQYYPNNDLVRAKYIHDKKQIQLREFYYYDDDRILTKKIIDNGQRYEEDDLYMANHRFITHYHPQRKIPYGLYHRIEDFYYDFSSRKEVLLKKIENEFSEQGHLLKQKIFDAFGQLAFIQSWDYDAHGNVIKETNPLGERIEREYDENDNLITQKGPHPDYSIKNSYDFSNRLVKQEEFHSDGSRFVKTHQYNYLSQEISSTDQFGNQTLYSYNDVGHLIGKTFPAVLNPSDEWVRPAIQMEYDIAGNIIHLRDALNREMFCENNIRGKPLVVTYPDGNQEKMIYRLDGQLTKKIEQNGTQVSYTLDSLGRPIKEKMYGSDGRSAKTIRRTYNGFSLLSEVSSDGTTLDYTYDFSGRLTETHTNKVLTQKLFYDALGRVSRIHDYYDSQNYRVTIKLYDQLNRVIEERVESPEGKQLHFQSFAYDCFGNKTMIKIGSVVSYISYNTYNKPVKIVDALGHTTQIFYNMNATDASGQRVLEITTVDPLGVKTIQLHDALNRLTQTTKKNSLNQVLSNQKLIYDLCGNCVRIEDDFIYLGEKEKCKKTISHYDSCSRLLKMIEAEGTPEQKSTSYLYNQIGQKTAKIKPDGIQLLYEYDFIGRLKEFSSSDHSIHYLYIYDRRGNLVHVRNLLKNTTNDRIYNDLGQLIEETLDTGLKIEFHWDLFDRQTAVILPDQTRIEYVYDASNLKEVHRINGSNDYSQYNLEHTTSGLIQQEKRPGKAGLQTYEYDTLNRLSSISTNSFCQSIPPDGFDAAGNLRKFQIDHETSIFNYDDLYQITSEEGRSDHRYSYDSLSNRRLKDDMKNEINQLNQVQSIGNKTFLYDPNGNLVEIKSLNKSSHYTYDAFDRLIKSVKSGIETTYQYDSFNRRISKKTGENAEILSIYLDMEEIGSWENNQITELKILNQSHRISAAIEINKIPYVPVQDMFGHTVQLLDLDGNLQESYSYSIFGEVTILDTDLQIKDIPLSPWLYSNRRYDHETGLYVFNLRYYDPQIGRWISPDPAGTGDGPNLYAHVHNNPLKYYDLMGLLSCEHDYNVASDMAQATRQAYQVGMQTYKVARSLFCNPDIMDASGFYGTNCLTNSETGKQFNYPIRNARPIMMTNGVFNTKDGFDNNLTYLTKLSDQHVFGMFDHTKGLIPDCSQYLREQYLGYSPAAVQDLKATIKGLCQYYPHSDILLMPHSRGCTNLRNALREMPDAIRQKIYVLAIAPGSYIDRYLCKNVVHLVSKGDWVPLFDQAGRLRCRDTIIELNPHPDAFPKFFDHSFDSPTYALHMTDYISQFKATGTL